MVERLKDLLAITAQARDAARAGNFRKVQELIDQRETVLERFSAKSLADLTDTQKVLAKEVAMCLTQLDEEIQEVVKQQMEQDNQEMLEITNKLRVLMAYSRGLRSKRRFDSIR